MDHVNFQRQKQRLSAVVVATTTGARASMVAYSYWYRYGRLRTKEVLTLIVTIVQHTSSQLNPASCSTRGAATCWIQHVLGSTSTSTSTSRVEEPPKNYWYQYQYPCKLLDLG